MYSSEQVKGLLKQQKSICANVLINKNGTATVKDMWDAPEPDITPDGIIPPLPLNCIINPHYDRHGRLDGGYVVKNGIITCHIDPTGETGPTGVTGTPGVIYHIGTIGGLPGPTGPIGER